MEKGVRCVPNVIIAAPSVAQIYRRSKICLNIHISNHEGINPRTFEILGTRSFELVDHKTHLTSFVEPGRHVISYVSPKDLIKKIGSYLDDSETRERLATQGFQHVAEKFTIDKITTDSRNAQKGSLFIALKVSVLTAMTLLRIILKKATQLLLKNLLMRRTERQSYWLKIQKNSRNCSHIRLKLGCQGTTMLSGQHMRELKRNVSL
jgi:hypothetical protein